MEENKSIDPIEDGSSLEVISSVLITNLEEGYPKDPGIVYKKSGKIPVVELNITAINLKKDGTYGLNFVLLDGETTIFSEIIPPIPDDRYTVGKDEKRTNISIFYSPIDDLPLPKYSVKIMLLNIKTVDSTGVVGVISAINSSSFIVKEID